MTVRTPDSGFESLERRYESMMRLTPYLLLHRPAAAVLLSQSPDAGAFGITAGVIAAAAAWVPGW